MKKVLFATTALIATASVAAADVRISGYGRFGLDWNDGNDRNPALVGPGGTGLTSQTNITSRLRLQFDMSAETDSGVAFGARFRVQQESRDNNPFDGNNGFNGARFFATYEGFSLGVGNIIGAYENTPGAYLETRTAGTGIDGMGFVSHVGNVNNEYFNWDSYSSNGTGVNGVEVIYSNAGFTGHISYSARNGLVSVDRVAVMGAYTFGDWTVAAAYQSTDIAWGDKLLLTVAGDLGMWGVRFAYADNDGIQKFGLYGNVDIGAASNLVLWVTDEDAVDAADVLAGRGDNRDSVAFPASNWGEGTSYGIHYSYDLGGGVSFETGYRRASNSNNSFQAGVYFSF